VASFSLIRTFLAWVFAIGELDGSGGAFQVRGLRRASSSLSARCFSCLVFDSSRSLPELIPRLLSFAAC